jgi:hypothetical protein
MKVGALIADAKARELLKPDEIADLNEKKVEKPDASFERIVLYIDDLDRCPPDKVVDVLQAIHMLLYFPLFVVVVAVDVRWVSRSLKDRFPKLLADRLSAGADAAAQNGPEAADAHDYLEKIFQIPFWVRRMDGPSSAQFVEGVAKQFAKTERSTGKDKQEDTTGGARDGTEAPSGGAAGGQQESPSGSTAGDGNRTGKGTADGKKAPKDPPGFDQMTLSGDEQKMLATFAPFVGGSPRRAKRYVNLYLLLKTILRPVGNVQEWAIAGLLANSTGTNRSDDNFLASFQNKSAAARAAGTNSKIGSAVDALIVAVSLNFPKQEDDLQTALQRFAPTVRRYSFW